MIRATYISHELRFLEPAGTSRGVLHEKPCWYLLLSATGGLTGIGEVGYIPGLSPGEPREVESALSLFCERINEGRTDPCSAAGIHPGICFAAETACRDLETGGVRALFNTGFTRGSEGIPVNGLIWMGDKDTMTDRIRKKLESGFRVLKMKVGALDFRVEKEILKEVRRKYGPGELEIRLDANGAWDPAEAMDKLQVLHRFGIHSVEQPVKPGQPAVMAGLCRNSPIPVALDEELIGVAGMTGKVSLLENIRPAYIILKPGLLGGWGACEEWIRAAGEKDTGWWITSSLESNIGLNAIAQWTSELGVAHPQGLGTGSLYANNIPSPLKMKGGSLWHDPGIPWNLEMLDQR
jgi:o-succinylbenzoate synthase